MHDAITVGIPVLAILFGILWNNQGLRDLKADLKADIQGIKGDFQGLKGDFNRLETNQDRMQADLSQFYKIMGEHGARLDSLEKRQGA